MSNTQQLRWNESTIFQLNGVEFSQLHNTLKMIVESPLYQEELQKARTIAGIGQMFDLTSKKLQEGRDDGRVTLDTPKEEPAITTDTQVHTMD